MTCSVPYSAPNSYPNSPIFRNSPSEFSNQLVADIAKDLVKEADSCHFASTTSTEADEYMSSDWNDVLDALEKADTLPVGDGPGTNMATTATCEVDFGGLDLDLPTFTNAASDDGGVQSVAAEDLFSVALDELPSLNFDDEELNVIVGGVGLSTGQVPSKSQTPSPIPQPVLASTPAEAMYVVHEQVVHAPKGFRKDGRPRQRAPKRLATAAEKQTDKYKARRARNNLKAREWRARQKALKQLEMQQHLGGYQ